MNIVKKAVKWSLRRCGVEVRRAAPDALGSGDRMIDFLRVLKSAGFAPKTIFDIGANRGRWTASSLEVFPSADYTLFEPQAHLGDDIRAIAAAHPPVRWRQCCVSDACGTAEFAQSEWDVCSRLATAEAEGCRDESAKRISVETTTVDEEIRKGSAIPDLLKIDAEGHDLSVLDGAKSALGITTVLLVEAAVCCPTMPNTVERIIPRMTAEGYSMAGIVDLNDQQLGPGHSIPGLLWLADFAFVLTKSPLMSKLQGTNGTATHAA